MCVSVEVNISMFLGSYEMGRHKLSIIIKCSAALTLLSVSELPSELVCSCVYVCACVCVCVHVRVRACVCDKMSISSCLCKHSSSYKMRRHQ